MLASKKSYLFCKGNSHPRNGKVEVSGWQGQVGYTCWTVGEKVQGDVMGGMTELWWHGILMK